MTIRTRIPGAFFDIADPAFSVSSAEVRRAREAGWYARTSYGLAVLRYDQVSRLVRHPALRQGSRLWPAHHGITSGPFADWWASWVLNQEGEAHHRMRRLLSPAFSRRTVEALRPRFGDLAGELADSLRAPVGPVRVHGRLRRALRGPGHRDHARHRRGGVAHDRGRVGDGGAGHGGADPRAPAPDRGGARRALRLRRRGDRRAAARTARRPGDQPAEVPVPSRPARAA